VIEKLIGREKVVWTTVSNKVNEIIDFLNTVEEQNNEEENKESTKESTNKDMPKVPEENKL